MKSQLLLLSLIISLAGLTQEKSNDLNNVLRINVLSPGIEFEMPLSERSTLAANTGIGIQGSYLHLDYTNSGITYYIAPFLDVTYKKLYNRESRLSKNKNLDYNSGNYWGIRLLTNFKEIESHNVLRKDKTSFALGPTWGIQRAYGKTHLLFDIGSVYYFDTKGNNGFFPVMLQLNLGFNIKKWDR
jgi:hypothetical protein